MLLATPTPAPLTFATSNGPEGSSRVRTASESSSSSSRDGRATSTSTSPGREGGMRTAATTPGLDELDKDTEPSATVIEEHEVNPLYQLSQRVELGDVEPGGIHVYKVREGEVIVREGRPAGLMHPLSWSEHDGAVPRAAAASHEPNRPGVAVTETERHSASDGLRIQGREIQQDLRERTAHLGGKGKERERVVDPLVVAGLGREGLEGDSSRQQRIRSNNSLRSAYATGSLPRPQTPPLSDETKPPATPPKDDRSPVMNAPGFVVTNSRSFASPISGSPSRLVPVQSLTKPLPSIADGTPSLFAACAPTLNGLFPPLRTSNGASSRRASTSGIPPSSRPSPRVSSLPRTMSYQHESAGASTSIPLQVFTPALDEVEVSIAAQEEQIRRERLSRKLEAEKERFGENVDSSAIASGSSVGPGQIKMKRRSTRAGSAGEMGAPGQGVLMGNLIGQDHANYVLMYNMLTGIRIGVSRCQAKVKRPLTDEDYTARHKFSFDIVGNELTPSTKYDFKFKDYAPWVFRELREYFYLDPSDYLVSLTAKYILSELGSPGKSGSFFYFSRDYRFIIKTIRHSEHKFLRSILKEYHEHIKKNPHTLLSRFYGLHRVKLPRGKKIHFVIMNNLFPPHRDIHETYDLKGSAIGRIYPENLAATNPTAILKDLNWVTRHRYLYLGPEKKALFEEQLRRDTELLQKLRIMDYSLLTGIHIGRRGNLDGLRGEMLSVFQPDTVKMHRKPTQVKRDADALAVRKAVQRSDPKALSELGDLPEQDTSERRLFLFYQDEGGIRGTGEDNEDLGVIYYLGIIDILTPYTFVKRVENLFKGFKYDRHMISAVPPVEYGDRFMAFIYSVIKGNDESLRPRMFVEEHPLPALPIEGEKIKEIKQD